MPFAYFNRLSVSAKRVYLASDAIREVTLPNAELLHPLLPILKEALLKDDHRAVSAAADALVLGITKLMRVPEVTVEVLAERPRRRGSELHGLYTVAPGRKPRIKVWIFCTKSSIISTTRITSFGTRSTPRGSIPASRAWSGNCWARPEGPLRQSNPELRPSKAPSTGPRPILTATL